MPNVLFSGVYYIGQQGRPQRSAVTDVESNVTAGMLVAIHPEDTLIRICTSLLLYCQSHQCGSTET